MQILVQQLFSFLKADAFINLCYNQVAACSGMTVPVSTPAVTALHEEGVNVWLEGSRLLQVGNGRKEEPLKVVNSVVQP